MSDQSRTPPVPSPDISRSRSTEGAGPADLNIDGLDLRRFSSLSPIEQLDKLEADAAALKSRERAARKAESDLKAEHAKEVKS